MLNPEALCRDYMFVCFFNLSIKKQIPLLIEINFFPPLVIEKEITHPYFTAFLLGVTVGG